jgi:hypothetical protein
MNCKVINSSKKNLEKDVNSWLSTGKYSIVNMVQTEDANLGYITLTIIYKDLKEVRGEKIKNINNS